MSDQTADTAFGPRLRSFLEGLRLTRDPAGVFQHRAGEQQQQHNCRGQKQEQANEDHSALQSWNGKDYREQLEHQRSGTGPTEAAEEKMAEDQQPHTCGGKDDCRENRSAQGCRLGGEETVDKPTCQRQQGRCFEDEDCRNNNDGRRNGRRATGRGLWFLGS